MLIASSTVRISYIGCRVVIDSYLSRITFSSWTTTTTERVSRGVMTSPIRSSSDDEGSIDLEEALRSPEGAYGRHNEEWFRRKCFVFFIHLSGMDFCMVGVQVGLVGLSILLS